MTADSQTPTWAGSPLKLFSKDEAEDWEARIQTALRLYVEANKAYLQTQRTAR